MSHVEPSLNQNKTSLTNPVGSRQVVPAELGYVAASTSSQSDVARYRSMLNSCLRSAREGNLLGINANDQISRRSYSELMCLYFSEPERFGENLKEFSIDEIVDFLQAAGDIKEVNLKATGLALDRAFALFDASKIKKLLDLTTLLFNKSCKVVSIPSVLELERESTLEDLRKRFMSFEKAANQVLGSMQIMNEKASAAYYKALGKVIPVRGRGLASNIASNMNRILSHIKTMQSVYERIKTDFERVSNLASSNAGDEFLFQKFNAMRSFFEKMNNKILEWVQNKSNFENFFNFKKVKGFQVEEGVWWENFSSMICSMYENVHISSQQIVKLMAKPTAADDVIDFTCIIAKYIGLTEKYSELNELVSGMIAWHVARKEVTPLKNLVRNLLECERKIFKPACGVILDKILQFPESFFEYCSFNNKNKSEAGKKQQAYDDAELLWSLLSYCVVDRDEQYVQLKQVLLQLKNSLAKLCLWDLALEKRSESLSLNQMRELTQVVFVEKSIVGNIKKKTLVKFFGYKPERFIEVCLISSNNQKILSSIDDLNNRERLSFCCAVLTLLQSNDEGQELCQSIMIKLYQSAEEVFSSGPPTALLQDRRVQLLHELLRLATVQPVMVASQELRLVLQSSVMQAWLEQIRCSSFKEIFAPLVKNLSGQLGEIFSAWLDDENRPTGNVPADRVLLQNQGCDQQESIISESDYSYKVCLELGRNDVKKALVVLRKAYSEGKASLLLFSNIIRYIDHNLDQRSLFPLDLQILHTLSYSYYQAKQAYGDLTPKQRVSFEFPDYLLFSFALCALDHCPRDFEKWCSECSSFIRDEEVVFDQGSQPWIVDRSGEYPRMQSLRFNVLCDRDDKAETEKMLSQGFMPSIYNLVHYVAHLSRSGSDLFVSFNHQIMEFLTQEVQKIERKYKVCKVLAMFIRLLDNPQVVESLYSFARLYWIDGLVYETAMTFFLSAKNSMRVFSIFEEYVNELQNHNPYFVQGSMAYKPISFMERNQDRVAETLNKRNQNKLGNLLMMAKSVAMEKGCTDIQLQSKRRNMQLGIGKTINDHNPSIRTKAEKLLKLNEQKVCIETLSYFYQNMIQEYDKAPELLIRTMIDLYCQNKKPELAQALQEQCPILPGLECLIRHYMVAASRVDLNQENLRSEVKSHLKNMMSLLLKYKDRLLSYSGVYCSPTFVLDQRSKRSVEAKTVNITALPAYIASIFVLRFMLQGGNVHLIEHKANQAWSLNSCLKSLSKIYGGDAFRIQQMSSKNLAVFWRVSALQSATKDFSIS